MSGASTKGQFRTPIFVGMLVAAGAIATTGIILASNALKQTAPTENPFPSIEIEMLKTNYHVGDRLDFAVHTYGLCATPNVAIWLYEGDEGLMVYQYVSSPWRCPPPVEPSEPHLIWKANQLVQRIGGENFGGNYDSIVATSAAIELKKAGNYAISASLVDQSKSISMEFTVTDTTNQ